MCHHANITYKVKSRKKIIWMEVLMIAIVEGRNGSGSRVIIM